MNLDRFLREREDRWSELERLLSDARGRADRLGPDGVRRLGTLYRGAAADLAIARQRFPDDPARARLERLVPRARQHVYDAEPGRESLREFATRGYWRRVRERPRALLAGWLLLLVPAIAAGLWALGDPGAAIGLVPEEFRAAADPDVGGSELIGGEQAAFASQVFTNNARVTFLAFAAGIALGLGTAVVVAYNGLFIGAIAGLAAGAGNGGAFVELVAAHGVLELSCIAVAASAGLRLGWSIVEPGRMTRARSLAREGRQAIELIIGTAPWLVLAGLVEGFVTPRGVGALGALAVGVPLGVLYWSLVVWRGRPPHRAPADALGGEDRSGGGSSGLDRLTPVRAPSG